MKSNSFKFSRKATTAVLLCTGLVAGWPLDLWAESGTSAVQIVQQQKNTVKGIVIDAQGPVIGASVVEKDNPSNGTITDMDGNFSLSVKPDAVLVIEGVAKLLPPQKISKSPNFHKLKLFYVHKIL